MFVAIIVFMLSPNNTHIEHERNKKKKNNNNETGDKSRNGKVKMI